MKMKEGVRITGPFPLDPPVQTKFTDSKEENCTGIINTRSGNQTAFGQCNICLNGVFTPSAAETETGTGAETRTLGGGAINLFLVSAPASVPASVKTPLQKSLQ